MLKNKCALVTGSVGGGLGYALAKALAGAGANIVLNDVCVRSRGATPPRHWNESTALKQSSIPPICATRKKSRE